MGLLAHDAGGEAGAGLVMIARSPAAQADSPAFPLFDLFPRLATTTPRIPLGPSASPVRQFDALSRSLGADVWLKNDGEYGSLYGGNKPRKLEFILADARRRGARAILTTGGIGSNHALATALYGRDQGLNVALALAYEEPGTHAIDNLLRMASAGAEIHYTRSYPATALMAACLVARYWIRDRSVPYLLGPGGSSPLAALGYVNAGIELAEQVRRGDLPEPASIVLPLGTGGTAAGLLVGLGLAGLDSRVLAVAVTRAPTTWRAAVMRLARATAQLIARRSGERDGGNLQLSGLKVLRDWVGPGLGRPSEGGARATERLTSLENWSLDPVYTAKAMAALLDVAGDGAAGPILFWHTHNTLPLPAPSDGAVSRIPASLRGVCSL